MLAIIKVADERCQGLMGEVEKTAKKFKDAFIKFSSCHNIFTSRVPLTNEILISLGEQM